MTRDLTFHVFCSIKGGVGKSTLAVTSAKLLAEAGRQPVLLDADLTGTSLSDGLLLRAPKVAVRADGTLDLTAPPTGELHDVDETRRLRNARKNAEYAEVAPPPAYVNDALDYQGSADGEECRVDGLLWRHAREDGVLYLPSSPLPRDVEASLGWLYTEQPFDWVRRLTWVLAALLERRQDVTDIVVDLPPGIWGFAHEVLVLAAALGSGGPLPEGYPTWSDVRWTVHPTLVTTADWNDLLPALEYAAANSARMPALRPLINRAGTRSLLDLRADARRRLDPALVELGVDETLDRVDELSGSLGQIFRRGDLLVDEQVRSASSALRLEGTR